MAKDFEDVTFTDPDGDQLEVERGVAYEPSVFFYSPANGAYLTKPAVRELVRRLTDWLDDGPSEEGRTTWEDA